MTQTIQPAALPSSYEDASEFVAAVGLHLTHVTGDGVTGELELGPEHFTPWGIVHGGVYTTVVESAASIGASVAVADRGQIAVGVHNSTDFLRSTTAARATVRAVPVQQGRTQQLWDVTITDELGRPLARGSLRLQNVPADRPTKVDRAR